MRVGFIGDTHCDQHWTTQQIESLAALGVEAIIQVGDFGFWPNNIMGLSFLEGIAEVIDNNCVDFYFIDGNHEYHIDLPHSAPRPIPLSHLSGKLPSNIKYLPRGYSMTIAETNFLFFGGAGSIDKQYRTTGVSWFDSEEPSWSQINRALMTAEGKDIDVLVSHDCTQPAFDFFHPGTPIRVGDTTRNAISEIVQAGSIPFNVHGHHHMGHFAQYSSGSHKYWNVGLGANNGYKEPYSIVFDAMTKEFIGSPHNVYGNDWVLDTTWLPKDYLTPENGEDTMKEETNKGDTK